MKIVKYPVIITAVLVLFLASCSPASGVNPIEVTETAAAESPLSKETPLTSENPVETDEVEQAPMPAEEISADTPAWFGYPLTEVTSSEVFKIDDYKGKVVLVETMAIWCSNCKRQQQEVIKLHEALGEREDFISLGLDIDINENAEDLKRYVASNNFDWKYAVASPEVIREISSLYGDQFLNPPSTPMLIVDRKGEVHTLPFGLKSASDLEEALKPYLEESA